MFMKDVAQLLFSTAKHFVKSGKFPNTIFSLSTLKSKFTKPTLIVEASVMGFKISAFLYIKEEPHIFSNGRVFLM